MTAGLVGGINTRSAQHSILGISLLALISSAPPGSASAAAAAESASAAPIEDAEDGTVTCYACGQPEANPNASFCDVTMSGHNCNLETTKIYNLSCSVMDNMREPKLKKLWERWEEHTEYRPLHYTVASSGMRLDFNQESRLDIIAARTS